MLFLVIQPCFSVAHSKAQCETFILLNHDNVDARRNWVKQQCKENLASERKKSGAFVFSITSVACAPFSSLFFLFSMFITSNYQFEICFEEKLCFYLLSNICKFIAYADKQMFCISPFSVDEFYVVYEINYILAYSMMYLIFIILQRHTFLFSFIDFIFLKNLLTISIKHKIKIKFWSSNNRLCPKPTKI